MSTTDLVLRVIGLFEKLAIPYVLVGSYSSNYYGRPRSTADADFVVVIEEEQVERLMQELGSDFQLEPQMAFEVFTMTPYRAIVHRDTAFKIELFALSQDPHHQEEFRRRRQVDFEGQAAWLPAPEDVIIQKLRWGKSAGRARDLEDAAQVVLAHRDALDWAYLRRWADVHGTRESLERLLATAT